MAFHLMPKVFVELFSWKRRKFKSYKSSGGRWDNKFVLLAVIFLRGKPAELRTYLNKFSELMASSIENPPESMSSTYVSLRKIDATVGFCAVESDASCKRVRMARNGAQFKPNVTVFNRKSLIGPLSLF